VPGGPTSVFGPDLALSVEADARIRTADPFITSEVLYQLSYVGSDQEDSAPTNLFAGRRDRHGGRGLLKAVPNHSPRTPFPTPDSPPRT